MSKGKKPGWFVIVVTPDDEFGFSPTFYAVSENEDTTSAIAWISEGYEKFAELIADTPLLLHLLQEIWNHANLPPEHGGIWDQIHTLLQKHKEHLS